jgi:hypothetical protein
MLDKTIDSALLALRKQIIRSGGKGLAEAETLLRTRGVHMPRVLPPRREGAARMGEVRRIILAGLRERPMCLAEVAALVAEARGEPINRQRTAQCLYKMKAAGALSHDVARARWWTSLSDMVEVSSGTVR